MPFDLAALYGNDKYAEMVKPLFQQNPDLSSKYSRSCSQSLAELLRL
jgi:hypothetical protein